MEEAVTWPAQSSFAAQLLLLPAFSFSPLAQPRPNFLSGPFRRRGPVVRFLFPFFLPVADMWARPVSFHGRDSSGESEPFPRRFAPRASFPAFISRRPTLSCLLNPKPSFRVAIAALLAAVAIRAFEITFVAPSSSSRFALRFGTPISRSCALVVVAEPPFTVESFLPLSRANHGEKPSSLAPVSSKSGEVPAARRHAPPRKLPLCPGPFDLNPTTVIRFDRIGTGQR
nr:unnamed protein product [Digitaria exilis]